MTNSESNNWRNKGSNFFRTYHRHSLENNIDATISADNIFYNHTKNTDTKVARQLNWQLQFLAI